MYIVFDLEWNNLFYEPKQNVNKSDINFRGSGFDEIIEFGAYKLDKNFKVIDKFEKLVKPVVYKKVANVVRKITGLTYEQLEYSNSYENVIKEFIEFLGKDYTLVTFSDTDIRVMYINNMFFGIDNSKINYTKYIDAQEVFTKTMDIKLIPSLERAAENLGIDTNHADMHTAVDDADLTVKVLKELSQKVNLNKFVKNANNTVHLPKFFEIDLLKVEPKLLKLKCLNCGKKIIKQKRNYNTHKNKIVVKAYCSKCCVLSIKSVLVKKSISGKNNYFVKESTLDRNKAI